METAVTDSVTEIKSELQAKNFETNYHGTEIKILEIEHQDINLDPKHRPPEFQRPPNWRQVIRDQIESNPNSAIFPEYCMPDLEKFAFAETGTGQTAIGLSEDSGITDLHSYIAMLAGMSGRSLFATDIANTNWYMTFEQFSRIKMEFEAIQRDSAPNLTKMLDLKEMGYEYGHIKDGEYQLHTANDARHLITARGLMEYAVQVKASSILSIWAPRHAERIDDYIRRQLEWERDSSVKIEQPSDFKYVSPKQERSKMKVYGKPPLQRSIREYAPTLPPLAYEIDSILNDPEERTDLGKVSEKIQKYLEDHSKDKQEQTFQRRMIKLQDKIRHLMEKGKAEEKDYKDLAGILLTNKFGWKSVKRSYIY